MKNFEQWFKIYEATLKGNPAIPGEEDKNEPKYLKDVEERGKNIARTNNVGIPDAFREMSQLVPRAMRLMAGKEKELEKLATDLIMGEYGSILDGVANMNIILTKHGQIDLEDSKLKKKDAEKKEEEKPKEEKKKSKISFKDMFKKKEEPKEEDKAKEEEKQKEEKTKEIVSLETHKRKIANNIIQGEAKNTKHIIHSEDCKNGLIEIFGETKGNEIHTIFDRVTKIMDALDWVIPESEQKRMWDMDPNGFAGKCEVKWDKKPDAAKEEEQPEPEGEEQEEEQEEKGSENFNEEGDINKEEAKKSIEGGKATINAYGVDFPMLIHEAVKGIYELIATAGQAEDIEVAKQVQLEADDLFNELEDLRVGPMIAADLRDFVSVYEDINKYPNMRERFFGVMVTLPAKEFLELMKGILMKTEAARTKVDSMLDAISEEQEAYEAELRQWEMDKQFGGSEEDEEDSDTAHAEDDEEEVTTKTEEPTGIDYSKMSKKQLDDELNQALDAGNYALAGEIGKFLKESIQYKKKRK